MNSEIGTHVSQVGRKTIFTKKAKEERIQEIISQGFVDKVKQASKRFT